MKDSDGSLTGKTVLITGGARRVGATIARTLHGAGANVVVHYRNSAPDAEKLKAAKDDALVMHPGPMNRGVEIASEIADGPQSVIQEQVEMGVAVRMAVMEALLDPRRNPGGGGQ